jgi:hypothetical protein
MVRGQCNLGLLHSVGLLVLPIGPKWQAQTLDRWVVAWPTAIKRGGEHR